jgi:hypothetical protein
MSKDLRANQGGFGFLVKEGNLRKIGRDSKCKIFRGFLETLI